MSNTQKKGIEKEDLKQQINESNVVSKSKNSERNSRIMIGFLAFISITGFAVSLLFLVGITGAVIGPVRGNLWGLIFIVLSLLIWSIAEILWIKGKKNKEVDVKKLLENAEKEIPTMLYKRSK